MAREGKREGACVVRGGKREGACVLRGGRERVRAVKWCKGGERVVWGRFLVLFKKCIGCALHVGPVVRGLVDLAVGFDVGVWLCSLFDRVVWWLMALDSQSDTGGVMKCTIVH